MANNRVKRGKRISNPARRKPVSDQQAKSIANREIFQSGFNADYDQIMKRISSAVDGLRNGAPPPKVS